MDEKNVCRQRVIGKLMISDFVCVAFSTAFQYSFFYFRIGYCHTEGVKFNDILLENFTSGKSFTSVPVRMSYHI
jgi:hypothetical protein